MPFTVPDFEPSSKQLENMGRLSEILSNYHLSSPFRSNTTLAELFREQGRFFEAQEAISKIQKQDAGVTSKLIAELINEKKSTLIRYRM